MVLNLSGNTIQDISALAGLKQLKIVDLSENSIANIDCFEGCNELVNIKLQGNMIKSVDNLRSLKSCTKLKSLQLQTLSGEGQNAVCQLQTYRDNVLDYLAHISRLDCIPKGQQISNGSELKTDKKK